MDTESDDGTWSLGALRVLSELEVLRELRVLKFLMELGVSWNCDIIKIKFNAHVCNLKSTPKS